jgi:hypothetical protein
VKKRFQQTTVALLVLSMSLLGVPALGMATPIGTETLIQLDQRDELLSDIQAQLARDEVRAEFLARGVLPSEVDERVAALSTAELHQLKQQIDELPAGGILAVIGVVFVVLLILDLVGVTNVFTKV